MSILSTSQKKGYTYVDFQYGDPLAATHARYTDWLTPADVAYTPRPTLEVKLPANTGVFSQDLASIGLPLGDAFTTRIASGEPISPVFVTISEVLTDPLGVETPLTLVLFRGRVTKAIRRYQGRDGSVLIQAVNAKSSLDVPLGLVCNPQCGWTFGGVGCAIDLAPLTVDTGVVDSISDGRVCVVSGIGAQVGTYWRKGYLRRDGLSIAIRDWSEDAPADFVLAEKAPAEWVGQGVDAIPGCDKTRAICESRWDNLEHFGGFGVAMPDYMPILEG